jgi:hypothetical protein
MAISALHRWAKPGSLSRQNPVPGLAPRAFRIDQEVGAVVAPQKQKSPFWDRRSASGTSSMSAP